MNKTYKLVNRTKKSFLTEDIGVKSENFTSVIILSTIIAVSTLFAIYYLWRI